MKRSYEYTCYLLGSLSVKLQRNQLFTYTVTTQFAYVYLRWRFLLFNIHARGTLLISKILIERQVFNVGRDGWCACDRVNCIRNKGTILLFISVLSSARPYIITDSLSPAGKNKNASYHWSLSIHLYELAKIVSQTRCRCIFVQWVWIWMVSQSARQRAKSSFDR